MAARRRIFLHLLVVVVALAGMPAAGVCENSWPLKFPETQYEPLDWADLDGWANDDHAAAFATFLASCRALEGKRPPSRVMAEVTAALKDVCGHARAAVPLDDAGARQFFEDNFRLLHINKLG